LALNAHWMILPLRADNSVLPIWRTLVLSQTLRSALLCASRRTATSKIVPAASFETAARRARPRQDEVRGFNSIVGGDWFHGIDPLGLNRTPLTSDQAMSTVAITATTQAPPAPAGRAWVAAQFWGVALVAPYVLVFLVFVLYPVGYGFWIARRPESYAHL